MAEYSPTTLRKKLDKVDRMMLDLMSDIGYENTKENKKYMALEKKKNEYEGALKEAESNKDNAKKRAMSAVERRILENAERRKNEALQRKLEAAEKVGGGRGGRAGTFLFVCLFFMVDQSTMFLPFSWILIWLRSVDLPLAWNLD